MINLIYAGSRFIKGINGKLFQAERVKRSVYGKESLLMHTLCKLHIKSQKRSATMNNEITHPEVCMESDILTISF
jgi:hypothetical protein